jgi:hypothetical protein
MALLRGGYRLTLRLAFIFLFFTCYLDWSLNFSVFHSSVFVSIPTTPIPYLRIYPNGSMTTKTLAVSGRLSIALYANTYTYYKNAGIQMPSSNPSPTKLNLRLDE